MTPEGKKFEIGVIYKANSQLHLAVGWHELITFIDKKLKCIRPYNPRRYKVERDYTVQELADRWHVSVEDVDEAFSSFQTKPDLEMLKRRR